MCHTSAGGWRLNRHHDSFRRPATCTLSSLVFLRVRGLDWNRGGAVGVVAGIWAGRRRNRGSILGRSKRCVPDPKLSGRLWDLSSILFGGYLGFSLGLKWSGRETGHLIHLVPRLGMTGAINIVYPSSISSWREKDKFYFVLLSGFDTGTKVSRSVLTRRLWSWQGFRIRNFALFGQCNVGAMHRFVLGTCGFWECLRRREDIFLIHCRRFVSWFICFGK